MPSFGGTTLAAVLGALRGRPPEQRTGRCLLDVLDRTPAPGAAGAAATPARQFLGSASYVRAVCWLGACLADALQYAHERGLVHLDLKPSNVLLAADGQPMLLDFHLAREPVRPGVPAGRVGGTPAYMSPEQAAALDAVREGRPVPAPVDSRSDVYSLGLLLYEALGGPVPADATAALPPLPRFNRDVSVGLADVLARCLAPDPDRRYPDAAALGGDLRRHLADLPLQGVANRSPAERWRKWRRRRPHGVGLLSMGLAVLLAAAAAGAVGYLHFSQRLRESRAALEDGAEHLRAGRPALAASALRRGLALVDDVPGARDLRGRLEAELRLAEETRARAERAEAARELHRLTDRLRFLYGSPPGPAESLRELAAHCRRAFWDRRGPLLESLGPDLDAGARRQVEQDLLDLAVLWADLHVRLAPPGGGEAARQEALRVLDQAEALFGPSPVLAAERSSHTDALGRTGPAPAAAPRPPRTAWEHYALGRCLLRAGEGKRAAAAFRQALQMEPFGLWPNYYYGLCAYHLGDYEEAVNAFTVCVARAPQSPGCYYNRALAYAKRGRQDRALADYAYALQLDPGFAAAALGRGLLLFKSRRYAEARADLRRALDAGGDPAVIHYNLALIDVAQYDRAAALAELRQALRHDPRHKEARELSEQLRRGR
jgi:tetratricopeptide (TPR) repeat protein